MQSEKPLSAGTPQTQRYSAYLEVQRGRDITFAIWHPRKIQRDSSQWDISDSTKTGILRSLWDVLRSTPFERRGRAGSGETDPTVLGVLSLLSHRYRMMASTDPSTPKWALRWMSVLSLFDINRVLHRGLLSNPALPTDLVDRLARRTESDRNRSLLDEGMSLIAQHPNISPTLLDQMVHEYETATTRSADALRFPVDLMLNPSLTPEILARLYQGCLRQIQSFHSADLKTPRSVKDGELLSRSFGQMAARATTHPACDAALQHQWRDLVETMPEPEFAWRSAIDEFVTLSRDPIHHDLPWLSLTAKGKPLAGRARDWQTMSSVFAWRSLLAQLIVPTAPATDIEDRDACLVALLLDFPGESSLSSDAATHLAVALQQPRVCRAALLSPYKYLRERAIGALSAKSASNRAILPATESSLPMILPSPSVSSPNIIVAGTATLQPPTPPSPPNFRTASR